MIKRKVDVVTLGCSKNLVDSERVLKMFADAGCEVVHNPEHCCGDVVVINTCGFIGDAKEESIETILQYVNAKNDGDVAEVYVMGCLSERYRNELPVEIPEVDGWYGKFDWVKLVSDISKKQAEVKSYNRTITTPSHYAYLKIAEGCNRFCAFCAIPLITGRFTSRPIDEIIDEVKMLVAKGVKEFNVIAQDLSSYGLDLYGKMVLPELVDRMAQVEGVKWIRLHYAYPAQFPIELLDVMARHENVCKYLDIALQHVSDTVLKNMRRHIDGKQTRELLATIRERVPGIHIRTTLMVGFPGEGEAEFEELKLFVKEQRFERMGAFAYCEEDDTFAAKKFPDAIPQELKDKRLGEIMALQEEIALETNQEKIGKTLNVVIDREEEDYFVGRTEWDSPEVDPEVLVKKSRRLDIGEFYQVTITDALPFELIGEVADV
ncbi:MAG: 30S ribosomal protein S12 methylthiotransferase RimO [Muribaculaceae bacterium]|nr:30S ribosomal protein S12 methylthiotransferase RimO [Muribaculaceae bacterium]